MYKIGKWRVIYGSQSVARSVSNFLHHWKIISDSGGNAVEVMCNNNNKKIHKHIIYSLKTLINMIRVSGWDNQILLLKDDKLVWDTPSLIDCPAFLW